MFTRCGKAAPSQYWKRRTRSKHTWRFNLLKMSFRAVVFEGANRQRTVHYAKARGDTRYLYIGLGFFGRGVGAGAKGTPVYRSFPSTGRSRLAGRPQPAGLPSAMCLPG